jgi:hypothetical protein
MVPAEGNSSPLYQVMHSGAWLPPSAWADENAWDRLICWIEEHCEYFDLRLIVTPQLNDQLNKPDGLRKLAHDALRQNARGDGSGRNWRAGDGPIIIVWPREPIVKKWVQKVAGLNRQRIILLEQSRPSFPSFQGWATAVGAFNAATGNYEQPIDQLDAQLNQIFTWYENELNGAPTSRTYGVSHDLLRGKLRAVADAGYDEDFIVTYAIALGYPGNLQKLRQHYAAARA